MRRTPFMLPLALAALTVVLPGAWARGSGDGPPGAAPPAAPVGAPPAHAADTGCTGCHVGIEQMHPWAPLSCTECHGGDGQATTVDAAHVAPRVGWPRDERVMHSGFDPPAVRFRNPSDLRVADQTCGACHAQDVLHLRRSLHGTTAGHLNDQLYENGVNPTRAAVYAVFDIADDDVRSEHGLKSLRAIEALRPPRRGVDSPLADHAADLPRKACMQCHLYSEGVGLEGRLGHDGLYRASGCAACHVSYAEDGLSRSADPTVDRFEPGHPLRHEMTAAPPTSTCVTCHVGDASIGNGFRGLAQLYPNMAAGPDIPGTTDRLIAEQFFLQDERLLPPDLHHSAGMHCVDCHTTRDVMGDGDIYGAMEHGVEIECSSCHGTIDAVSDLRTSRGRSIGNLERSGDLFVLRSQVTGRAHRVKQAAHVVDPDHPDHNPRAAEAMTGDHGRLECYACHSGWNTNFFGFHFDRNEAFTQLDLITGQRTDGAVSTQERVFASLRPFVLGWNSEGRVAPYMVGFSTMGTVHGADGDITLDQGLPRTAEGLSGMTMIHHQTHTTQPAARSCVACHRSPATWGLGSGGDTEGSFALARGLVVAVGERGVETLLLDREDPQRTVFVARLPLGGATRVVLDSDPVTGRASTAYVAVEAAGVAVVDVRHPAFPEVIAFVSAGDVRDLTLAGDVLYLANGEGGVRLVDVSQRRAPRLLSDLATREARSVDLAWPRLYVADGPGGLLVVDVSTPAEPRIVGHTRLSPPVEERADDAWDVDTVFQYGRPDGPGARTPARMLAAVANGDQGLALVDVTEPEDLRLLVGGGRYAGGFQARSVTLNGRYELGDTTGVTPTVERDLAYLTTVRGAGGEQPVSRVFVVDVTDPSAPRRADDANTTVPGESRAVVARSFNPPELVTRLALPAADGLRFVDVTDSEEPAAVARLEATGPLRDVAFEAFAFDRMVDETGRRLKDVSHEGARFFTRDEQHRVLTVPSDVLGGGQDGGRRREALARTFAGAADPGGSTDASLPAMTAAVDPDGEGARLLRLGFAVGPEEPIARLVRPATPLDFDANGDRALSRGELERLVFDLLDANGDGELDLLEWPRHPDPDPRRLDRNGDETVTRAEMDLSPDTLALLDLDGDGQLQEREWPFEFLERPAPSLTYTTPGHLSRIVSRIGWAKAHPELYVLVSGDFRIQPHDIPAERFEQLVGAAQARPLRDLEGLDAVGGFMDRWDIDRDGAVDVDEYAPLAPYGERLDPTGDGRVDERDRPAREDGRRARR